MTRIRIRAHAKINLHLGILGLRPDGYHEVETVLQTLDLHDTLTCERHDGPFALRCDRPGLPVDATNLVWRAAVLLAQEAGQPALAEQGPRITIEKRIPLQAGLGGGSSDAAATLWALTKLWQLDLDGVALRRLGSKLGADVPFFVEGGTALGTGRGDEIQPLPDVPALAVLVVMPPFGVPTADAYRWVDDAAAGGAPTPRIGTWPTETAQWPQWAGRCRNDFEPVIAFRHPEVGEAIARLRAAGAALAALSGSGAALFGVFAREVEARAAAAIAWKRAGWKTFLTRTVPREETGAETANNRVAE
jgi:4-diphosphocytidyl-2-C-methyl-D-erythritol kinase